MSENLLNEIKAATGWPDTHFINQTYVLRFKDADRHAIKGLRRDDQTFYLDFSDFTQLPISFLVEWENTTSQYWTINRRLHRIDQTKPAKVVFHNPSYQSKESMVQLEYFYNGLRHRVGGPAIMSYVGYDVLDTIPGTETKLEFTHYLEKWSAFEASWWRDGITLSYPGPGKVTGGPGYRIHNVRTDLLDREEDQPTTHYNFLTFDYTDYSGENKWLNQHGNFYISHISLSDLREFYKEGSYVGRVAEVSEFRIKRPQRTFSASELSTHLQEHYLNNLNLWDTPLFLNNQDEFVILSDISLAMQKNS